MQATQNTDGARRTTRQDVRPVPARRRTMRAAALVLATFVTSGCASTLRVVGDDQQIGPVSVFDDVALTRVQIRCQEEQSRLATQARAPNTRNRPAGFAENMLGANRRVGRAPVANCQLVSHFVNARGQAASGAEPAAIRTYFDAGAALSDFYCAAWFNQLDGARRTSKQGRDTVAGLRALTTAIQGFTGVEPKAIGITSTTLSQGVLALENTEANYLLSPQLVTVNQSLFFYRERFYKQIVQDSLVQDYNSAVRYLRQYDMTCSSLGVQYFVDTAVQNGGRGEGVPVPATLTPLVAGAVEAAANVIAADIGAERPLSSGELVQLYAFLVTLPERTQPANASEDEKKAFAAKKAQQTAQVESALKAARVATIGQSRTLLEAITPAAVRTKVLERLKASLAAPHLRALAAQYVDGLPPPAARP
jgi:hypothetical protein